MNPAVQIRACQLMETVWKIIVPLILTHTFSYGGNNEVFIFDLLSQMICLLRQLCDCSILQHQQKTNFGILQQRLIQ